MRDSTYSNQKSTITKAKAFNDVQVVDDDNNGKIDVNRNDISSASVKVDTVKSKMSKGKSSDTKKQKKMRSMS